MNNLKSYTQDLIKAIELIDLKQVSKVEKLITKKILLKKKYLPVEMVVQPQLQIIFYVILIKELKLVQKIKLNLKPYLCLIILKPY